MITRQIVINIQQNKIVNYAQCVIFLIKLKLIKMYKPCNLKTSVIPI